MDIHLLNGSHRQYLSRKY